MRYGPFTLSADGTVNLCDIERRHDNDMWLGTIAIYGGGGNDFGGGTVNIQYSPDGGTTYVNLPDLSGTVTNVTSDTVLNLQTGAGGRNDDQPKIRASLAGSTSPTIIIYVHDNR